MTGTTKWATATNEEKAQVILTADSWSHAARLMGTTKNAVAGFIQRNREKEKADKPKSKIERHEFAHTEASFIEKYADRKKRLASASAPSDKLKGRPRAEWTWSDDKKRRFKHLYNKGVIYKVIMAELDIGSKEAVSQAVRTLGLKVRQRRVGQRELVKVRVEADTMQHLRMSAAASDTTISRYVERLIRLDMGVAK